MARALAIELTEVLDVVESDAQLTYVFVIGVDRLHAREVQDRIQQHGGMASREDEAVAIGPDAIFRIEAEHAVPERVHNGGHRHRGAGMAGVSLLHGIHTQRADGVYAELVELFSVHEIPWGFPVRIRQLRTR